MPLRYTKPILEHLASDRGKTWTLRGLAKLLGVEGDERDVLGTAIEQLVADGQLDVDGDDCIRLPIMGGEIVGRLRLAPRGFGFVIPETPYREGDLFIPPGGVRDAISGDTVRARVRRQKWRAKSGHSDIVGEIVEVLERGQEQFVGVLTKRGKSWFVEPDGRTLRDPVLIRDPHAKNAKAGDKVVIELLHYPEEEYHAEGVITRVLGEAGLPSVETQAVIEAHGLRTDFPPEVLEEAKNATDRLDEPGTRLDLTDKLVITIDPPDAKDFDDAITIERDGNTWTLGVHIADVAHFVRPGSALDEEGKLRGNSVYLPRLVLPMLPETLSNGVCSLQEGVKRLTKSVFISFDGRGRVTGQRVAATVIKSRKRFTYLEAQALIDGDAKEARRHTRSEPVYTDEVVSVLHAANELAHILRSRRIRDGMIVLDLPEVDLVFDDDGHVVDAVPEDDAFTHTIIEMFMVEANEALARLFDDMRVAILRRIHPDPTFGAMEELRMYARAVHFKLPDEPSRVDLQRLLDATRESPAARAIHFALLRTLSKASYSPALIGHFALASDHYAHFTSPIRRYPDLTLHRVLEAFLDATENGTSVPGGRKREQLRGTVLADTRALNEGDLITLGRHCSDTEIEATAAERELRSFLVMQFLEENHLGDEFTGIITGVSNAGVFVSIERFLVEGLIRTADLPGDGDRPDRWKADQRTGRLVAAGSRLSLGIGDAVTVQIVKIDLASRHLDLRLTSTPERRADDEEPKRGRGRGSAARGGSPRGGKSKQKTKKGKTKKGKRGRS